jgi:hypothetical protein
MFLVKVSLRLPFRVNVSSVSLSFALSGIQTADAMA